MKRIATALALLLTSALVVGATTAPAEAAPKVGTSFVVDTQFWLVPQPSDIVTAVGPLAACTSVTDLFNGGKGTGPNRAMFFGVKQLNCGSATVIVSYKVEFRPPGTQTEGTWKVEESTLPGVTRGGGRLVGDNTVCEIAEGSDGCILDSFSGTVS